ncbi:ABC transporter ATP-binding protein [Lacticaseibacillus hegangensis]|uniref:ABC transporter ATP-binding protein n=1 Tax=Lacticaseibacillus hegangensis TaxID=2486010 RepID=A0ABW4CW41_9LACO|nr:ATP-binding cassette domain-containing protein [Lacticaseibacillus hegangensis]
MSKPAIIFDHVTYQYDSQAEPTLHDINLTINQGEKVLIIGPSGSGKSTLGNLINGLIPHAIPGKITGQVTVMGQDVENSSLFDLSLHVGTVLQDPDSQFVGLTAAEDIAFAMENDATPQAEMKTRVRQWATTLGIKDQLGQSPQALSGGQKQRTAMAGVLVDEGDVLLFDEPLAALDPATGKQSIELIDDLHRRLGITVVIIEHRLEEVLAQPVDRVIVMQDGRIIANETPEALLKTPLLREIGLREPLYLEALDLAGIDFNDTTGITSVNTIEAPNLKQKLSDWLTGEPAHQKPAGLKPLLAIKDLTFGYPKGPKLFDHFDLTINRGDMLALVGENGVGKTTLSQLITGFVKPDAGTMTFAGADLATQSVKERADQIGYIMQDPNQMISKIKIFDEVALGLTLRGVDEATIKAKVEDALKICGLYPFRNWPISALSFGQKKRVTIASILTLSPQLLILDEPTAGQDWRHYTAMMRFLEKLNRDSGITMLLITHDMHLMLEYATRTVVLGHSGILLDAEPAKVLTEPAIIKQARLAETSLYTLAKRMDMDPFAFTAAVIAHERQERHV